MRLALIFFWSKSLMSTAEVVSKTLALFQASQSQPRSLICSVTQNEWMKGEKTSVSFPYQGSKMLS